MSNIDSSILRRVTLPPPSPALAAGAVPAFGAGDGSAGTSELGVAVASALGSGGALDAPSWASLLEGRAEAAALLGLEEPPTLPDIVDIVMLFLKLESWENMKSPSFSEIFQFAVI